MFDIQTDCSPSGKGGVSAQGDAVGCNGPLVNIADRGGRRSGLDRREFSYSHYIPERRRQGDRRSGKDRRKHPRVCFTPILPPA